MRSLVVVVLVSAAFIFFQGKTLGQYQVHSDDAAVQSPASDQNSDVFSSYSYNLSQVFGDATVTNAAPDNEPPPSKTWLVDPESHAPDADASVIPRVINKLYFQKGSGFPRADGVPANLTAAHESWEAMNPGYDVRYFDLAAARKYLRRHFHPVFLRAFDCLPAFASKSDLFRMALLYREGGWHSDWKQTCLRKHILRNISEATDIFAAYDMFDSNDFFPHKCVQNAFVGSRPRHPIIAKMLEMILVNVQTMRYNGGALDATSTCIFGRAAHQSEEERGSEWFSQVAGKFVNHPTHGGAFEWRGDAIVRHKCEDCGGGQDWGAAGNNYILLYKHKHFYCEDAASLFRTTEGW